MKTLFLPATSKNIAIAAEIIIKGGLVAFPTETVYGLGANALNPGSVSKIYAAKGRPTDNPLITHVCGVEMLEPLTSGINARARALIERFWPGPLTLILEKSGKLPAETTAGLMSAAFRMPSGETALELIKAAGPIAAPSANSSGRPSPTSAEHVREDLDGKIECILDGGRCEYGLESTILDLTRERPRILRPGAVTVEVLRDIFPELEIDKAVTGNLENGEKPSAPGQKYRHYAPKARLMLVSGPVQTVAAEINRLTALEPSNAGILATDETVGLYDKRAVVISVGSRAEPEAVASNLFRVLREFDETGVKVIYSESFDSEDLGFAIMNRLLKASGFSIIKL